jgi:hypothetical protein
MNDTSHILPIIFTLALTLVIATVVMVLAAFRLRSKLKGLEELGAVWPGFASARGLVYTPAGPRFWLGPGLDRPPTMQGRVDGVPVQIEASHLGRTNLRRTWFRASTSCLPQDGFVEVTLDVATKELSIRSSPPELGSSLMNEAQRSSFAGLASWRPALACHFRGGRPLAELSLDGHVHDEKALDLALRLIVGVVKGLASVAK